MSQDQRYIQLRHKEDIMINSVSLRIQSSSLYSSEITNLIGKQPTHTRDIGDQVSLTKPSGNLNKVTTWTYEITVDGHEVDKHIDRIGPLLKAIGNVRKVDEHLYADLTVMMQSRSLGYAIFFSPESISSLASARCGIMIDSYDSE